jgi:uncharacterized phage protein gp47/JayE
MEADMESRLTGGVALLRFGILRILIRVFAGAMHLVYGFAAFIGQQLFIKTATGEFLDRLGYQWGVNRKAADFAVGSVTFTGTDGTVIDEGTAFQTDAGVEFLTTAVGTIAGGTLTVAGIAAEAGAAGNIAAFTAVELVEPLGITTVSIPSAWGGGVDPETDEAYRQRILERIQDPPAGGTAADYVRWAKEVSGVDAAWTFRATPAPGTVTVVIRGTAVLSVVYDYIAQFMPVTTDLIVQYANDVTINFTLSITPNTTDLQTQIQENVEEFFAQQAAPGVDMLRKPLENAISTAGIDNFTVDLITGTTLDSFGNLQFSGFDYPVLGAITFNELV